MIDLTKKRDELAEGYTTPDCVANDANYDFRYDREMAFRAGFDAAIELLKPAIRALKLIAYPDFKLTPKEWDKDAIELARRTIRFLETGVVDVEKE